MSDHKKKKGFGEDVEDEDAPLVPPDEGDIPDEDEGDDPFNDDDDMM